MKSPLYLHPEIIKFWENSGLTVVPRASIDSYDSMLWDGIIGKKIEHQVAFAVLGKPTIYYYNYKEYNEEELLRIVRLKSFM